MIMKLCFSILHLFLALQKQLHGHTHTCKFDHSMSSSSTLSYSSTVSSLTDMPLSPYPLWVLIAQHISPIIIILRWKGTELHSSSSIKLNEDATLIQNATFSFRFEVLLPQLRSDWFWEVVLFLILVHNF